MPACFGMAGVYVLALPVGPVDDIAEIAENETEENAILIAQDRNYSSCLDDLSMETYRRTSPTWNTK
jgi:hypothetical protein